MQIVDAAPELLEEIVQEMEVTEESHKASFAVRVGYHATLGRVVVITGSKGEAVIVQLG